jgi:hypothetical protein
MPATARAPKSTYLPVPVTDLSGGWTNAKRRRCSKRIARASCRTSVCANRARSRSIPAGHLLDVESRHRTAARRAARLSRLRHTVHLGRVEWRRLQGHRCGRVGRGRVLGLVVDSTTSISARPRSRRDLRRRHGAEEKHGRHDVDHLRDCRAECHAECATARAARSSTAIRTSLASPAVMTNLLVESNESATVQKATTGAGAEDHADAHRAARYASRHARGLRPRCHGGRRRAPADRHGRESRRGAHDDV